MVRVNVRLVAIDDPESRAVIVKFDVPAVVGLPLMTPVLEFSESPGGRTLPLAMTKE